MIKRVLLPDINLDLGIISEIKQTDVSLLDLIECTFAKQFYNPSGTRGTICFIKVGMMEHFQSKEYYVE